MTSSYASEDQPTGLNSSADLCFLQARAQAYEEAVSLALFASAWMQHSGRDARASRGARQVARLLAAASGQPSRQGPDAFAAARRLLEEEHE